ncbi:hypothetical protein HRbin24_00065 [bacterium HR24]|nr:hypothetical protein HRbin24_00065 [bacterium HR24]
MRSELPLPQQVWEALYGLAAEARRQVEKDGGMNPIVVAIGREQAIVMEASHWDEASKHETMRTAGAIAARISPMAVALVADIYYLALTPSEGAADFPPSLADDPRSVEAVCLAVVDRRGNSFVRLWPYRREVHGLDVRTVWLDEGEVGHPPQDAGSIVSPVVASFWQGVDEATPPPHQG